MKRVLFALFLFFLSSFAAAQNAGNRYGVIFPMANHNFTATQIVGPNIVNNQWRGIHLIINLSAYSGGVITPVIQAYDTTSNTYYNLLTASQITTTGITVLRVYPELPAVINQTAQDILPAIWRAVIQGQATATYSVSYFVEM